MLNERLAQLPSADQGFLAQYSFFFATVLWHIFHLRGSRKFVTGHTLSNRIGNEDYLPVAFSR